MWVPCPEHLSPWTDARLDWEEKWSAHRDVMVAWMAVARQTVIACHQSAQQGVLFIYPSFQPSCHPSTHPATHIHPSLTPSPLHPSIHLSSPVHLPMYPPTHPRPSTHSSVCVSSHASTSIHPLTRPCIHPHIHIHLPTHLSVYCPTHPRSSTHSHVCVSAHPPTHLFLHQPICHFPLTQHSLQACCCMHCVCEVQVGD